MILLTIVVIAMFYITFDVLSLTQCPSLRDYYQLGADFKKVCTRNDVWADGYATADLVLDLWVLVLPIWSVSSASVRSWEERERERSTLR